MVDQPSVRSATPKSDNATNKVPPPRTPSNAAVQPEEADPTQFWDDYFAKTTSENSRTLFQTVEDLIGLKKFKNAEAALKGFLLHRGKDAEPWMYVMLGKCIQARHGEEDEIKKTLGFAAFLAKKTKDPNDLVRVADMLVIGNFYGTVGIPGYQTNVGELIDLAADKIPANAVPPMMSINLATHDHDPKRMSEAVDRLLSLGWPGIDDKIRQDSKQQVKALAEILRVDGKTAEADALMTRLAASEVRDLYVRLTWKGEADIDLAIAEPLGTVAKFQNPRTVMGGAIIKNGYGSHPEEIYVCPRGFEGDYVITIAKVVDYDEAKPVTSATLEVIVQEGSPEERRESHQIDLNKPSPIVVRLKPGEGRRKVVLPFLAKPERRPATDQAKAKAKQTPKPIAPGTVPFR